MITKIDQSISTLKNNNEIQRPQVQISLQCFHYGFYERERVKVNENCQLVKLF